jgi:outer membrane protein TolC
MKSTFIILIMIFFISENIFPQELTIGECYKLATDSYPQKKNIQLNRESSDLKIQNIKSKYFPEITLFGQVQYQSDVTKLDVQIPLFPNLKLDLPKMAYTQYKFGLNINQLIWDGGIIANQTDIEQTQGEIERKNIEIDLYNLRQRVNEAYFLILNLQEKEKSVNLLKEDLKNKLEVIQARVNSGVVLESNSFILMAEIAKLEQTLEDVLSARKTAIDILGELLNRKLDNQVILLLPNIDSTIRKIGNKNRPEYELFTLSKKNIGQAKDLTTAKYMPKFSAYIQGVYGLPGLNMFDTEFKTYYIAGIKGSWSVWNWGIDSREKELLSIQQDILSNQEDTFTKNLNLASVKYSNDIDKITKMLVRDEEIIKLREKIKVQTSSQLDNGVITSTEYLTEINAESQARLQLEIDRIELVKAKVFYMTQMGITIDK